MSSVFCCVVYVMNLLRVTDINECTQDLDDCSSLAECSNTVGSYECRCIIGYEGDGKVCSGMVITVIII